MTWSWKTRDYKPQERPTADRDRVIVLPLTDTGLRASSPAGALCGIKIGDLNLNANSIKVLGKGNKERVVYFGKRAPQAPSRRCCGSC